MRVTRAAQDATPHGTISYLRITFIQAWLAIYQPTSSSLAFAKSTWSFPVFGGSLSPPILIRNPLNCIALSTLASEPNRIWQKFFLLILTLVMSSSVRAPKTSRAISSVRHHFYWCVFRTVIKVLELCHLRFGIFCPQGNSNYTDL